MKIGKPELFEKDHLCYWRAFVQHKGENREIWFNVPRDYRDMITSLSDPALAGLLIPAMASGEKIVISGDVSERLYRAIEGPVQHVLKLILPGLSPVPVKAGNVTGSTETGNGVATGFSGGVDAFNVLADHFYDTTRSDLRLTHLLFHNVGSHGTGDKGRSLFRERFAHLKPFAKRTGLPFVLVDSNLDEFYPGFTFMQTHTLRNAAAVMLLQRRIGHFLYASSYSYITIIKNRMNLLCLNDSLIFPLISNTGLELISCGAEYTRLDKIKRIASIEDSYDALNVCVSGVVNCSACSKCLRTLYALELTGNLEHYSSVFDLETYHRYRYRYLPELLNGNSTAAVQIREIMRQKGIRIPFSVYLRAGFRKIRGAVQ